jgi:hypothetical protein
MLPSSISISDITPHSPPYILNLLYLTKFPNSIPPSCDKPLIPGNNFFGNALLTDINLLYLARLMAMHCLLILTCYTWQDFLAAIFLFLLLELNVKKANRATCNNGVIVMRNINGSLYFSHFFLIIIVKENMGSQNMDLQKFRYFRDKTAWFDMAQQFYLWSKTR